MQLHMHVLPVAELVGSIDLVHSHNQGTVQASCPFAEMATNRHWESGFFQGTFGVIFGRSVLWQYEGSLDAVMIAMSS